MLLVYKTSKLKKSLNTEKSELVSFYFQFKILLITQAIKV